MTHRDDLFIIGAAGLRGYQAYQETGDKRYGWEVGIKTWLLGSLALSCLMLALGATPMALIVGNDNHPLAWAMRFVAIGGIVGSFFSIRAFVRFWRSVNGHVAESQLTPPPIPETAVECGFTPGQITYELTTGRFIRH